MAATIQYGRCTNKARCSLAYNRETVFVPLDGRCPECGQPLEVGMAQRRLKILPVIVVVALLGAGGYYVKKHFLDPGGNGKKAPVSSGASWVSWFSSNPTPTPQSTRARNIEEPDLTPPPDPKKIGLVQNPNFDIVDDANAKAQRDVRARIDVMPHLSPAQKSKLAASVDHARGMGCIFVIPFDVGKRALDARETGILVSGFQSASITKLMEDPTLVFVILGYADNTGDPAGNERASIERAQSVLASMRDSCGVQNVMYSVGMGATSLLDGKSAAKNRLVEIWAVFP